MASLVDTWDFASLETELREFLGIPTGEDLVLSLYTTAALKAGDQFMVNPFKVDGDGDWIKWDDDTTPGTDVIPPDDVKLGVFEWVAIKRRSGNSYVGSDAPDGSDITQKKTGDFSETYGNLGSSSGNAVMNGVQGFSPHTFWWPYKLELLQ
jgi:hypothetical protein